MAVPVGPLLFVPQSYGMPDFVNCVTKRTPWREADQLLPAFPPHERGAPTSGRDESDKVLLLGSFDESNVGFVFPVRDGVPDELRIDRRVESIRDGLVGPTEILVGPCELFSVAGFLGL